MATTTTITKLLFRRGNDSDRAQTVLASGEPGWCLDTNRLWIGDGVTPGGYPALSAKEEHLQYEPKGLNAPQALNINIPGLDRTLTDQWGNDLLDSQLYDQSGKYLYPANDDIRTFNNLYFVNEAQPGIVKHTKLANTSDGATTNDLPTSLYIDCLNGSKIDIGGGAIVIEKDKQGTKSVKIETNAAVFEAVKAVFDEGVHTHFEDKTVDLNVKYVDPDADDPVPEPEGDGSSSNDTGLYFAHQNYLSAGFMRVGTGQNDNDACSVLEFNPTVYKDNWDSELLSVDVNGHTMNHHRGFVELDNNNQPYHDYTDASGNPTKSQTAGWEGGGRDLGDWGEAPKYLRIHSPRPDNKDSKGYSGLANLVFESGLIVYGPGDPTTGSFNAYRVNQSVDTGAHPTFKGLTIQPGGEPIPVTSGGTGVTALAKSGVVHTPKDSDVGPLQSQPLAVDQMIVGTKNGIGITDLKDATTKYIEVTTDAAQLGQYTFSNKFCPDSFYPADKVEYIDKWYSIQDNAGNTVNPSVQQSNIAFQGVNSTDSTTYLKTSLAKTGDQSDARMELFHLATSSTDALYSLRSTEAAYGKYIQAENAGEINCTEHYTDMEFEEWKALDPATPFTSRDSGKVIGSLRINGMGHLEGFRVKDLDTRYAKYTHVGTRDIRVDGKLLAPANTNNGFSASPSTNYPTTRTWFTAPAIPDPLSIATGIYNVVFNDYGTVKSWSKYDLNNVYLTVDQLQSMFDSTYGDINSNAVAIDALDTRVTTLEGIAADHESRIDVIEEEMDDGRIVMTDNVQTITHQKTFSANKTIFTNELVVRASDTGSEGAQITLAACQGGSSSVTKASQITGEQASTGCIDVMTTTSGSTYTGVGDKTECLRLFHHGAGWCLLSKPGDFVVKKDIIAFATSDKQFKDNLKPIDNALDITNSITGYRFDWNDKQPTFVGEDVGVVAQEVEEVLPEVVATREDGSKAVRYEKLIPVLIESIKTLTARVEELESQLK